MKEKSKLLELFLIFTKMGAFTIGGGYAMLPLVESELTKRNLLSKEEMEDMIVLAQSAPGLLAVNLAIYTGHKLCGIKGSIVATIGATLPSFIIILLIAMLFTDIQENVIVAKIFQAVRPVAVSLILVPAVNMFRSGCRSRWTIALCFVTIIGIVFLKLSPIWFIIITLCLASGIGAIQMKKGGKDNA